MQYTDDKKRFAELLSKFTGIKQDIISEYLKSDSVKSLIENPSVLKATDKQLQKFSELKELHNITDNLRTQDKQYVLDSSSKSMEYFKNFMKDFQDKERFVCAFLDKGNRIISTKIMSYGTIDETPIYPRDIAKEAILKNARAVILAHNHPGGALNPSKADIEATKKIADALYTIRVSCQDHIIVADNKSISLAERGYSFTPPSNGNSIWEGSDRYKVEAMSIKDRMNLAREKAAETGVHMGKDNICCR